jgi:hypothetical protein
VLEKTRENTGKLYNMEHKKFKHSLDKHDCHEIGFSAEVVFKKLAEEKGYLCRVAGREEQFSHVDFILTKGKDEWRVDVKGAKRKKRTDDLVDYSIIWLEFKNGNGGEGWLVKENGATNIAFELENEFIIVSRKDLLKLAKKLCNLEKMVAQSKNALYCGYKRFGRRDLLSIIKTEDLLTIKHSKWSKT